MSEVDGRWVAPGDMARRIAEHDWAATPIGAQESWPESLRLLVDVCLASPAPLMIAWGPEAVQLYNDALAPLMGDKHPAALGMTYAACFPEIWESLQGPQVAAVLEQGASTYHEDQQVCFVRNGVLEEMYWTFGWSPIRAGDGQILGAFHPASEGTNRVLGERRLAALVTLAGASGEARRVDDVLVAAMAALGGMPDLPFCILYLTAPDGSVADLAGTTGLEAGGPASPEVVSLAMDPTGGESWPLASAAAGTIEVDDLAARFGALPGDPWPEPSERALIVPVGTPRTSVGFLVAGLSPRRPLDRAYQDFVELVARQLGSSIIEAASSERQHEISSTLQRSFLPAALPSAAELAVRYVPGATDAEVGGDWYDVVPLDAGRHLGLVIGDVMGHDLGAAAAMGRLSSALRAYALDERDPAKVLDRLHHHVSQLADVEMTTLLYGVLDTTSGTFDFASAGHPPPLLLDRQGVRFLEGGLSAPIGAPSDGARSSATATLEPGATLVLYTDGLVESRSSDLRTGFARLLAAASEVPETLEELVDHLLRVVPDPSHDDDIAVLGVRLVPPTTH